MPGLTWRIPNVAILPCAECQASNRVGAGRTGTHESWDREMPIDFKNPPINEVVVAVYFNPPLSVFHNEHVGLFWERIRHDFPVSRQAPLAGPPMEIEPGSSDGLFPMPRYCFVSEDGEYQIQIQKNAFALNWNRSESTEYPRFLSGVKPAFDKNYHLFDEFISVELNTRKPSIGFCELAYFNTIAQGEFWHGLEDTQRVIPSFLPLSPGVEEKKSGFNCSYAYEISTDLVLNITVRSMMLDETSLILAITARGFLDQAPKSKADEWFERAHGTILRCFTNITNPDIRKRYWGLEEETS